jgi:hypothetical protein
MGLRERLKRGLERQYYQARKYMLQLRIGNRWEKRAGFVLRQYPDYQTYLEHQKTKYGALRDASIARHDRRFHAALAERLASLPIDFRGGRRPLPGRAPGH